MDTTINKIRKTAGRRPYDRDALPSRIRLLDVAEELFADQGYAATSIREVAERANVNPAMIHYHFGSKHELMGAVLDRALKPLMRIIAQHNSEGSTDLVQVVGRMFDMANSHPAIPRLLVREVMLSGGPLRERFVKHYAPRLGGALPALIAKQRDSAALDKALEPGPLAIMLLSLAIFPHVAKPLSERVLTLDVSGEDQDRYREQLALFIRKGIAP